MSSQKTFHYVAGSLLTLLGAVGCAANRPSGSAIAQADLQRQVEQRFATLEAPGAVYGLYRGDGSAPLLLALGYADEKHTRRISLEDHFRIGSVTKAFVGTVVLQMLDEGKLSLDDPIAKYVSGVPGGDAITLRMLGNHTSGLPTAIANPEFQKRLQQSPARPWTTQEILDAAFQIKPVHAPGKKWYYSNTNTVLLGMVVEKISGRTWKQEVQTRILDRLNLKQTGFPTADGKLPEPTPKAYRFGKKDNLVKYGDFWFDATDWSSSWAGASGDMYGTLDDLAIFARAQARGDLVGEAGRRELFAWYDTRHEGIESGFHLFRQNGAMGVTGDVPGFSAFAAYLPDRDITIICLANLTATRDKLTAAAELGELTVKLLSQK